MNNQMLTVIKLNPERAETWRYSGNVIRREPNAVVIEAFFNREDTLFHGILLKKDDRFVEIYYTDRWYNIYEMYDREDDHLKGWYCNVSQPAELSDGQLAFVDLALDLLVYPDGRQLVLDEDEFEALHLSQDLEKQARAALEELQALFRQPGGFRLEK